MAYVACFLQFNIPWWCNHVYSFIFAVELSFKRTAERYNAGAQRKKHFFIRSIRKESTLIPIDTNNYSKKILTFDGQENIILENKKYDLTRRNIKVTEVSPTPIKMPEKR